MTLSKKSVMLIELSLADLEQLLVLARDAKPHSAFATYDSGELAITFVLLDPNGACH